MAFLGLGSVGDTELADKEAGGEGVCFTVRAARAAEGSVACPGAQLTAIPSPPDPPAAAGQERGALGRRVGRPEGLGLVEALEVAAGDARGGGLVEDGAGHWKARARRGRRGTPALQEKGQGAQPKSARQEVTGRSTQSSGARSRACPGLCPHAPALGSGRAAAEGTWRSFSVSRWEGCLTLCSHPKVVQSGGKNIELAIMRRDQPLKVMAAAAVAAAGIRAGVVQAPGGRCGLGTGCVVLSKAPRRPASVVTVLTCPFGPPKSCPQLRGCFYLLVITCRRGAPPHGWLVWLMWLGG